MRQTVLGVYDSYADGCSAQRALGDAGIAQADITIYSMSAGAPLEKGPRVYAPGSGSVRHTKPVFDQLEQLFARLFPPGEYPPDAEDYREFIRRGGTIVSADVSEMQVEMARDVMRRAGAADIEEQTNAWRNRLGEADISEHRTHQGSSSVRETSSLYGASTGLQYDTVGVERKPVPGNDGVPMGAGQAPSLPKTDEPAISRDTMQVSRMSPATGDVQFKQGTEAQDAAFSSDQQKLTGGMQQVRTRTEEPVSNPSAEYRQHQTLGVADVGVAHTSADAAAGVKYHATYPSDDGTGPAQAQPNSWSGSVSNPVIGSPLDDDPYDDEFRRDYDDHYAHTGGSYDEYRRAYTHGATLGQDERYRAQDWTSIESSARDDWESRYPESGWERFKAAVRHGWERVTGH
ncbi:hypothetical protein EVC45_31560 [Paraburkholderia sp. UYCP14C]|uniref:hypothetical protein n=1 Tax=Paraburkholderia sp. UYCP14C TaxID=2511130 RepID=UPI00101FDAA7|nr:hypothetical protein [Paraburkholderia sp. UYCP14C]RZF25818.1 hypothetical protein EVC45_31560 [Paraburkholderia sp. UYCP14C]